MIKKLGGLSIIDLNADYDVFISDEPVTRSIKFLLSVNIGAKIVNLKWLIDSNKKKSFIEEFDKYLALDSAFDKKYKIKLKDLYASKDTKILFKGLKFKQSKAAKKGDLTKWLIESAGGVMVPPNAAQADICIFTDEKEDKAFIATGKKNRLDVCHQDTIYNSIIHQRLLFKEESQ